MPKKVNLAELKWESMKEDYINLLMQGKSQFAILSFLQNKYFLSESTIRVKLFRKKAILEAAARIIKENKTTPKRETQLQPMNGVEYR